MGNARDTKEMECVRDPEQTTAGDGGLFWSNTIAAQCCESDGQCRREVDGECVAGHSKYDGVHPTTYAEAVALCEDHGLQLCASSCTGEGCWYNRHPVWTSLPCEADLAPPPSSPPPPSRPPKDFIKVEASYGTTQPVIFGAVVFVPTLGIAVVGYMYRRRRKSSTHAVAATRTAEIALQVNPGRPNAI